MELRKNEFFIVKELIEDKNHMVKRECLMDALWEDEGLVSENRV
ncbi:helix-turn-helix domain-containing protein, partial [Bacillus altitudinis]